MASDFFENLPKGWQTKTVSELVKEGVLEKPMDGNHGGIHPKSSDYVKSGIPFVMASDLVGGRIDYHACKYIPTSIASNLKKGFAQAGDVLLSHKATIGRTALVQSSEFDWMVLTPQVTYYRIIDTDKLRPGYLRAYFGSYQFQSVLSAWAGSGSTRAYLGITGQLNLPIIVPPIRNQINIERVSFSFTDKVFINQKINQTLEQIAQALFKSWFVDFEPVKAKMAALEAGGIAEDAERAAIQAISGKSGAELDSLKTENPDQYDSLARTAALFPSAMVESELGEIPEGWSVGTLGDMIGFNPKRSLKKGEPAPYLDMKNLPTHGHLAGDVYDRPMGNGTRFINGDTLLARITPCLENGKTAFVDFLEDGQVGWGSTEYIVMRPKEDLPECLAYFIARQDSFRTAAIQSMTGTSGRQRASAKTLAALNWVQYPKHLLDQFDVFASSYLRLAKSYGDESRTLAELRDTLLPKLLSGELTVPEAEHPTPEAANA